MTRTTKGKKGPGYEFWSRRRPKNGWVTRRTSEMTEGSRDRVDVYRTNYLCDRCKDVAMVHDHNAGGYCVHRCPRCGDELWLETIYPIIQYEEADDSIDERRYDPDDV